MNTPIKRYIYFLVACLLLTAGLTWFEQTYQSRTAQQFDHAYKETQQLIIDKELSFINLLQNALSDTGNLQRSWSDIMEVAQKNQLSIYIFKNDTLHLWSDNLVTPSSVLMDSKKGTGFAQYENGYYLTYKQIRGPYTFLLLYLVKTDYHFKNQYIQDQFSNELSFIKEALIVTKPLVPFKDIHDLGGNYLFSIEIFTCTDVTPLYLVIAICLFIALGIGLIHVITRHYIKTHLWITTLAFFIFFGLVRVINVYFQVPEFLYKLRLFNPFVYASSSWFPSLGDLLLDSVLLLWYFILLESRTSIRKPKEEENNFHYYTQFFSWFIMCMVSAHVALNSIKSLTIDSQISFDINNVFSINFFTYVGIAITIIQLLTVYFIVRNFVRLIRTSVGQRRNINILGIFTGLLVYIAVVHQSIGHTPFQIAITVCVFLSFLFFKLLRARQNRFQQYFVVIFTIAVFSSISINHWLNVKERENRKLFAVKLASQNDITTDYFLRNVEQKINHDPFITEYFQNPLILKSQFEKRIRQLYFTGYLGKYEVSVLDYDTLGYHFKQRNNYSFRQINSLYEKQTFESINTNFRYIRSNAEIKSYLAKFVITKNNHPTGYLFVLLKPKLIQDENRFDELLIEGFRQSKRRDYEYSYAVYKDKNLLYQSGDFPYRITNTWGETDNTFRFFKQDNYSHLLYTDKQPLTVVVSKKADNTIQTIGLFSFIFTFCSIALILVLFVYVGINTQMLKRYQWLYNRFTRQIQVIFNRLLLIDRPDILYIRTRIQTSIIFIVFITLLFSSYFTISFISQKYNDRQTERLMKKLRNVVLTIENENIKDFDWQTTGGELEAFINQIADFYNTDVTLFDAQGRVIASSISKIFDEGIISKNMPPDAFYHLTLLKESQFTENENISSLSYQAAYAPVFKNKSEVLGYLQLPYFSQQADLLNEISSIVVGFINLYVLLFIIIGVLAYLISRNISYPLTLIQQRLSGTVLGGKNEPINWQRDDEIGELVRQYNAMITQLEASARRLAETEREGAWREIARQIAHEIKNPLTPMKLSIQHLQRAFKNNDPNIEEKINRTTKLLIDQIDTLSDLANEFSSFAKMPVPNYELINVCSELQQIIDLYSLNTSTVFELKCYVHSELHFDRSYFSRSIGNIIKNAIQAIPDDRPGLISINATEDNENIVISVKDNGTGISKEQAANIFMPYFSTKISGMGLGLPIVKNMIESGKGSISFTSEVNKGTVFIIKLPKQT